jgi:hypothetical protein
LRPTKLVSTVGIFGFGAIAVLISLLVQYAVNQVDE